VAENRLRKFLEDLAQDPQKWAEFKVDPGRAMSQAGLSKAEQDALRSRDPERLRSALKLGPKAFFVIVALLDSEDPDDHKKKK